MTVNNDIDDDSATKHGDSHTPRESVWRLFNHSSNICSDKGSKTKSPFCVVLKTYHLTGYHHNACLKHFHFSTENCVPNCYPHGTPWQQQRDRGPKGKRKTPQQVETRFKTRQSQHAPRLLGVIQNCVQSFKSPVLHPWDLHHSTEASNLLHSETERARANKAIAALNRIVMSGTHANTICAKLFDECVLGVRANVFTTNELKGKGYHEEQSNLSTTGAHSVNAVVNVHVVNSER